MFGIDDSESVERSWYRPRRPPSISTLSRAMLVGDRQRAMSSGSEALELC